jgi:Uma2 family endonuclease
MHQVMLGTIYIKIANYISGKKGQCVPIISPIDVQLDCDDKTILQPDVIVVCDRDKIKKGVVYGGPDFVVEVISPSTRSRDKNLKLDKYMRAGVREYWIVDPKKKNIVVYADDGADDYDIFVYTFEHEVPVRIFDNECKIDFKEIYDYIAFMYEK